MASDVPVPGIGTTASSVPSAARAAGDRGTPADVPLRPGIGVRLGAA